MIYAELIIIRDALYNSHVNSCDCKQCRARKLIEREINLATLDPVKGTYSSGPPTFDIIGKEGV